MLRPLLICILSGIAIGVAAQVNVPVNGPHEKKGVVTAFTHATVHPAPGEVLRDATLVIEDDHVVAVGPRVDVPAGANVVDLRGMHIWPGLVEPFSDLGLAAPSNGRPGRNNRPAPPEERQGGAHFWNSAIRASTRADELFTADEEKASALRAQGFTTVITRRMDGIARGTSAAVELAGRSISADVILPRASAEFSFRKGSSKDDYPSSLMGSIALIRQSLYDARWYAAAGKQEQSDVELEALNAQLALPLVFEASDRNDVLRIARIGREFGLSFIVKGAGDEYARLADIIATRQPLIVPLVLPEAYDVEDPFDALEVTTAQLKHWELAPTNAQRIAEAEGTLAFTTQGLKEPGAMWPALRRMLLCGLDTTTALAALTTTPARLFRLEQRVGTLRPGMLANLIVTSEHLFSAKNRILETWVAGARFAQAPVDQEDPRGTFDLNLRSVILRLKVTGEVDKPEAEVSRPAPDSTRVRASLSLKNDGVTLWFAGDKFGFNGPVRLNGMIHDRGGIWDGQGLLPDGSWTGWSAVRQSANEPRKRKEKKDGTLDSLWALPNGPVWYPDQTYGLPILPDTEAILFRHATVWTNGPQGILSNADVCISGGRIVGVGDRLGVDALFPGRRRPILTEIDATGKHITCGIIDEHSHIAIARGVNEGGQAISAEVRVGDVIDPDDVDIYRNLSGGVTAVQQLHGSANPIGGQSSLIKLRWGQSADAMPISGADGFIKFALGENVKQSNWGLEGQRFPQTRMGVEQIMFDAFHRAKEYEREWDQYRAGLPKPRVRSRNEKPVPVGQPPRRDLELDALAEILDHKRFITCHSYVQSEIAMLMHVADSMGFRVNTFTHILEGYKLARQLKDHGANASTFSDWWAYKYEVMEAIPYNAAILTEQGVNTCINSDDAEMSRRLNQEAAKTMKYGGMSPEQAWKMVTLNPARALHLDARMGSVEIGKDADIVVWSGNPLSVEAKAEVTFVDGVRVFDRQRDLTLRKQAQDERARIITKMLSAKKAGAPARKAERHEHREWQCETLGEQP